MKRDIEGRRREAITGNLNNYSTQTKEKKIKKYIYNRKKVERREKKNRGATVPLKGPAEEVCALTWIRHLQ